MCFFLFSYVGSFCFLSVSFSVFYSRPFFLSFFLCLCVCMLLLSVCVCSAGFIYESVCVCVCVADPGAGPAAWRRSVSVSPTIHVVWTSAELVEARRPKEGTCVYCLTQFDTRVEVRGQSSPLGYVCKLRSMVIPSFGADDKILTSALLALYCVLKMETWLRELEIQSSLKAFRVKQIIQSSNVSAFSEICSF